jgi:hypothetical protein
MLLFELRLDIADSNRASLREGLPRVKVSRDGY